MIKLGLKAKDKVTGFEGILVARAQYLTGCDQYGIAPLAQNGEVKNSHYFDEGRIVIIGEGITANEVESKKPGGPNRDCPTK